jgi:hypothetical protein
MNSRRNRRSQFGTLVDVALAALAVGGAAFVVDLVLLFHWTPRTVAFDGGEALYYPTSALLVIAGIGAALVVAGLRLGLHRQYHNWLFVGTGAGVLVLGTSFAARERVVITPEEFAIRRWWGLQSHAWRYDNLNSITVTSHSRRRGGHWVRVCCESKGDDGPGTVEEVGSPRLLGTAQLTLQTHARARGVAVTWTQQHWRRRGRQRRELVARECERGS